MKMKLTGRMAVLGLGGAGLVYAIAALAHGIYPGFPLATNSTTTAPLTGNETWAVDTNLTNGQQPQTVLVGPGLLGIGPGAGIYKNMLIGGDFTTNLFQRTGTTSLHTAGTYTADRWAVAGGSSSLISVSKQTGATDIPVGFGASARFGRTSGSDVASVCIGQVVASANMLKTQGGNLVFSFHGFAPTTFSASGGQITVSGTTGTTADEGSASFFGTNNAGSSWTGAAALPVLSSGSDTAGANNVASGSGSGLLALTATWQRYWVAFGPVPAGAKELGVKICYTPVGTASSDYLEFTGAQLELNSSGSPTAFERRNLQTETELQLAYYQETDEAASDQTPYAVCQGGAAATTGSSCIFTFPVPFRATPTLSYTAGTITCTCNTSGAAAAVSALVITKASTRTALAAATGTSAAVITGILQGGNSTGGGAIKFTAEL